MNEYMQWAKELKDQHTEVLKYYSTHEVKRIWEDYSQSVCAHWLIHTGMSDETVKRIFDDYMIINHWELWKRV